jgi:hypothetical protein
VEFDGEVRRVGLAGGGEGGGTHEHQDREGELFDRKVSRERNTRIRILLRAFSLKRY